MRALLVLPLLLFLTACPVGDRCSNEEAAYVEEVRPFLESSGLPIPECQIDPAAKSMLFQQVGVWWPSLVNLDASLQQLNATAPPEAFRTVHDNLVGLVDTQVRLDATVAEQRELAGQFWRWIGRSDEKAQLVAALARDSFELQTSREIALFQARAAIADLNEVIAERSPSTVYAASERQLVFRPKGTGVEVSVGKDGAFSVDNLPLTLPTPVGDISTKVVQNGGVRRLVIRSGGKQRLLKMDRPFRLFVPARYGFDVVSENQDVLILYVHDEGGAALR